MRRRLTRGIDETKITDTKEIISVIMETKSGSRIEIVLSGRKVPEKFAAPYRILVPKSSRGQRRMQRVMDRIIEQHGGKPVTRGAVKEMLRRGLMEKRPRRRKKNARVSK